LQKPVVEVSEARPVEAVAASFRYLPRNFFARNGLSCSCEEGVQMQINQMLEAKAGVLMQLEAGSLCWSVLASNPQRQVQAKQ
jgi:hypothetical protein